MIDRWLTWSNFWKGSSKWLCAQYQDIQIQCCYLWELSFWGWKSEEPKSRYLAYKQIFNKNFPISLPKIYAQALVNFFHISSIFIKHFGNFEQSSMVRAISRNFIKNYTLIIIFQVKSLATAIIFKKTTNVFLLNGTHWIW